jgi:hypothetical protein
MRLGSAVLTAAGVAALVVACGGSSPSGGSASKSTPTASPTAAPTAAASIGGLKDLSSMLPPTVAGLNKCSAQANLSGVTVQPPVPGAPSSSATPAPPPDLSQFAQQGVNGGYSEEFASDGFCPGQTPANPSAMLTAKIVSLMVVSFTDSAHAQSAWTANFLNIKDATTKAGAAPQPAQGLGANSLATTTNLPTGSAMYIAAWQNGSYIGLVFSYGLASADAQGLAAQVNSKMS